MARSSASRKPQQRAAVFDFVPFLVRRHLDWRVRSRGVVLARSTSAGVITIVYRTRDTSPEGGVEQRIAQLRPEGVAFQLFWKKGNGRWTAYCDQRGKRVVGSLAECIGEISRDPFRCYWS